MRVPPGTRRKRPGGTRVRNARKEKRQLRSAGHVSKNAADAAARMRNRILQASDAKPSEQTPEKKRRKPEEKKRREKPGKQNKTRETADGFCAGFCVEYMFYNGFDKGFVLRRQRG